MSQKRMPVSLTVLEIQRQKWTGGILPPPPDAGIKVKQVAAVYCEDVIRQNAPDATS